MKQTVNNKQFSGFERIHQAKIRSPAAETDLLWDGLRKRNTSKCLPESNLFQGLTKVHPSFSQI
jgi:hypothetical protein